MSKGRIEQVGTPDDVYRKPASPFVADFVGRMNFVEGKLVDSASADCRGAVLTFASSLTYAVGTSVTICVRPEDVEVRNTTASANSFDVDIGVMEFMGNHFSTTMHVLGSNLNISADLSMNDVRDLGIKPGARVKAALPSDRLRVFATAT
jgi:iron(III) transport system ATP-binding protein